MSRTEIFNNDFDDELLSAFVDDELTAAERAQVESRLKSDARAAALVEELRTLSSTVKSLPREKLPRDLRAAVMANVSRRANDHEPVVLSMPSSSERWALRRRGMIWSAIAIAAAVLLSVTQTSVDDKREVAKRSPANAADDPTNQERKRELFQSPADSERPVRVDRAPPSLSAPAAPAVAASPDDGADSLNEPTVLSESNLGMGFRGGIGGEADATKLDALATDGQAQLSPASGSGVASAEPAAAPASTSVDSSRLSDVVEPTGEPIGNAGRSGSSAVQRSTGIPSTVAKGNGLPSKTDEAPRIVEITIARADAVARFKQLLAENKLAPSAARQLAASSSTKIAASAREEKPDEILVEASPGQVEKLLFQCRSDKAFAHIAPQGEQREGRFFADPSAMSNRGDALEGSLADEASGGDDPTVTEDARRQRAEGALGKRKESEPKTLAADSYQYGAPAAAATANSASVGGKDIAGDKVSEQLSESTRRLVLFRFLPAASPATSPAAASPASK